METGCQARKAIQYYNILHGLNAPKASYRDMQTQIQQGQDDVDYFGTAFHRQQALLSALFPHPTRGQ
jgi:hypothetical protein